MRIELPQEKKIAVRKQIESLKTKKMSKIRDFAKVVGSVWLKALPKASRKVRSSRYVRTIYSDSSMSGWGAYCNGETANGLWNQEEKDLHINHLELKAAFLALKCLAADLRDSDVLLMVDNTTTLAYINRMGGVRYSALHKLVSYGFMLQYAFRRITVKFGNLEIDLFASRINDKCATYCSWKRDPGAFAFDAFTICWSDWVFYAFPPFSIITKVIKKIRDDRAEGILVVPYWPTQVWFPAFKMLSVGDWIRFDVDPNILVSPCRTRHHPLAEKLILVAARFDDGIGHSTLNSARAALSLISSEDVTNNQLISRFIKGSSKIRPSLPTYKSTWDVDPVLKKLAAWFPLEDLTLKELTSKLVVLLALGTAHRSQTLALIKISNIIILERKIEILIPDRIKTSRPGAPQPVLRLPFFHDRPELCIAQTLNRYLSVTKNLRGNIDSLFISFNKPQKAVTSKTISRWIRSALEHLGVDKRFTAHSTRHASTSKACKKVVSIAEIKKVTSWSPNSKVFADFYQQPINIDSNNFTNSVISIGTSG
ncbi:uncharacterized protein LOC123267891 [Cotesia glomerata]|uniref:uncharacterized protein LOC123267891 n=1 Tax=Cotesia glomerata TaxID=32391 RepID=UPI001D024556|nr:uncharacterized protein LOC123267891 [Cotesia glomerata]